MPARAAAVMPAESALPCSLYLQFSSVFEWISIANKNSPGRHQVFSRRKPATSLIFIGSNRFRCLYSIYLFAYHRARLYIYAPRTKWGIEFCDCLVQTVPRGATSCSTQADYKSHDNWLWLWTK